ncbi:MAG TPA: hypothetical protein VK459_09270 [Polyangiaceae bacterium]|jgi:hypothetical protein|nr:hypothetical protein [Polyangiaceae bacterium]
MANEALVHAVKTIMKLGKEGRVDEAYQGYRSLFESPDFETFRPEDQRQALRLMIHAKGAPEKLTEPMAEAHRAALRPLTNLVNSYGEPSDHELLGVCYSRLGDTQSADTVFRAGLNLERERNPSSDLCGLFMKRISLL